MPSGAIHATALEVLPALVPFNERDGWNARIFYGKRRQLDWILHSPVNSCGTGPHQRKEHMKRGKIRNATYDKS